MSGGVIAFIMTYFSHKANMLYGKVILLDEDVSRVITPYKSKFFQITLLECTLAAFIILLVLALKFFMPKTYKTAQKWYAENVTVDTNTQEIIKGVYDEA